MQGDKRVEIAVPEDKLPVLDELYDALKESVAETSEEFMDKYFSGEDFTYAEMSRACARACGTCPSSPWSAAPPPRAWAP